MTAGAADGKAGPTRLGVVGYNDVAHILDVGVQRDVNFEWWTAWLYHGRVGVRRKLGRGRRSRVWAVANGWREWAAK